MSNLASFLSYTDLSSVKFRMATFCIKTISSQPKTEGGFIHILLTLTLKLIKNNQALFFAMVGEKTKCMDCSEDCDEGRNNPLTEQINTSLYFIDMLRY